MVNNELKRAKMLVVQKIMTSPESSPMREEIMEVVLFALEELFGLFRIQEIFLSLSLLGGPPQSGK